MRNDGKQKRQEGQKRQNSSCYFFLFLPFLLLPCFSKRGLQRSLLLSVSRNCRTMFARRLGRLPLNNAAAQWRCARRVLSQPSQKRERTFAIRCCLAAAEKTAPVC